MYQHQDLFIPHSEFIEVEIRENADSPILQLDIGEAIIALHAPADQLIHFCEKVAQAAITWQNAHPPTTPREPTKNERIDAILGNMR